jgi:hypothetical protein
MAPRRQTEDGAGTPAPSFLLPGFGFPRAQRESPAPEGDSGPADRKGNGHGARSGAPRGPPTGPVSSGPFSFPAVLGPRSPERVGFPAGLASPRPPVPPSPRPPVPPS